MSNQLTAGFDIAGQIGQETIENIFKAYYESGTFPSHVKQPYQSSQGEATMDIFFGPPSLKFITQPSLSIPLHLKFPFLFRLSTDVKEYAANASVVVSTAKESVIVGAEEAVVITIDFSGLGDHLFEFELEYGTANFPPEFETDVKAVIISSLKAASTELQISPTLVHGSGFFTAQSYVLPYDASFLGIFVNESNVERAPPEHIEPYPYISSIAIPADTVNASIQKNLQDMGLDPGSLPSPLPGDPDYTVYALSISLRNGYLKVTGDVDDIDFTARLGLTGTGNGFKTVVKNIDFDIPWYLDILDAFSAGAITRSLEEELPNALNGLSQAVSGLDVLADSLPNPNVPGNPVTIRVEVKGNVTIRTDGLIPAISVTPEFNKAPIEKPTYVKANKETKEFHRGTKCQYGKRLKWQNTKYLIDETAAIRLGYNGCWTCAREFSHPAGRLIFGFKSNGHSPGETIEREIEVEGKLMEPMVIDGVEVTDPPFLTKKTHSRKVNDEGTWSASNGFSSNLVQPGLWRFTARFEGWVGTCELEVKPTATNFGATNHVHFTIGEPNGDFSYKEITPHS